MLLYIANTVLTLLAALLLGFIIQADWAAIRPLWKPILIMGALQQVVLAYGCLEALDSHVKLETRQVLFFGSALGFTLAILLAIVLGHRSGQFSLPFARRRTPTG